MVRDRGRLISSLPGGASAIDNERIERIRRRQLGAGIGDENIVDDARADAVLGDEHGRLDRDHHARAVTGRIGMTHDINRQTAE